MMEEGDQQVYRQFLRDLKTAYGEEYLPKMQAKLRERGLCIDEEGGRLLCCDAGRKTRAVDGWPVGCHLVFVRHGETPANAVRTFQGHIDESPINALNDNGRQQAREAASSLCDYLSSLAPNPRRISVLSSPLSRATDTAQAFIDCIKGYGNPAFVLDGYRTDERLTELRFGTKENMRVDDTDPSHPLHLLYRFQNCLVKDLDAPNEGSENFAEVLLRCAELLDEIASREQQTGGDGERVVVMFGHSLSGGALKILCGRGEKEGEEGAGEGLVFSGRYKLPHAQPIVLI
ncbi:unnamed protein product [Vitrella brassicaformis CCMP3155]|uniref:Uncharacterized protein n=1 Tax=Vitrella brassicaformis (strain CCMP3155) TaxID=1169540 RepID=A0A0G4EKL0_VITBC|nr:unnamed protein product [Vitrella brassicaformis CCMP3155]|eukprot:CEL97069.1 unnamed protein product [Vitrella brassicaformis CCMP3155]